MIPKYRAWFSEASQMITDDLESVNFFDETITITSSYYDSFSDDYILGSIEVDIGNAILMQSTGLKDKNDVEIFDGDIVVNHVGDVWVITYFRGAFRYYTIESYSKDKEKLFETDNIGNFGTEAFEVLGNVYENYELLEGYRDE